MSSASIVLVNNIGARAPCKRTHNEGYRRDGVLPVAATRVRKKRGAVGGGAQAVDFFTVERSHEASQSRLQLGGEGRGFP